VLKLHSLAVKNRRRKIDAKNKIVVSYFAVAERVMVTPHRWDFLGCDDVRMTMEQTSLLPRRMMRRSEAAKYLNDKGLPYGPKTMAKLAVVGGGPPFRKAGRIPLYDPIDLDAWVCSKLSPLVKSTSELAELSRAGTDGGLRAPMSRHRVEAGMTAPQSRPKGEVSAARRRGRRAIPRKVSLRNVSPPTG